MGAAAALVYAALWFGTGLWVADRPEPPTAVDERATETASAPARDDAATGAGTAPREEPVSDIAEATAEAGREVAAIDPGTVDMLAEPPTRPGAYEAALAPSPLDELLPAPSPLPASTQTAAADAAAIDAEDMPATEEGIVPEVTEEAAEEALAEVATERVAAAETQAGDAAASAIPLPPSRPDAEGAGESAVGARLAALENVPVPPLRPRGEALPWQFRPVAEPALATRTASAVRDLFANRYSEALAAQAEIDDPLSRSLIEFLYVRDSASHAPWRRIQRFLEEHPGWPSRDYVEKRLEVALLAQKAPAESVITVFADRPPATNPGRIALAQAYLAEGRQDEAREIASALWRRTDLTSGEERLVRERLGSLLRKPDHRARAVRLVYTGELSDAASLASRLDDPDKTLIQTAANALRGDKKALKALEALPKTTRAQPVALFAKARLARRAGEDEKAGEILMKAPADEDALAAPDEWWLEQKLASRWLLERGRAKEAYELTLKHAAQSAAERSDAEWQAGWIALRFLDDPDRAIRHFAEARGVVNLPISVARGEYWLGRAYEARGDRTVAREHFATAAEHYSTYYGQLALHRLGHETIRQPQKPIYAHTALRWAQERAPVKAIRLLMQLGHEELAAQLMISLARETDDKLMQVGLAELADLRGLHTTALTIGKLGTYGGAPTEFYAFTTRGLPAYPVIGRPVDSALVYAIARQESVFNSKAMSHAGARGLMQLMPATASRTARSHGQAYHESRLIQDPTYNVMIGAAHLGELLENFDGAYAMVFGAYNAGGGRVYEWIERFGDPRKGEIDPVDWVELIPYAETRNYVQRVMEGLEVYRARLGDTRLRIAEDLGIREAAHADGGTFETASQAPLGPDASSQ